MHGKPFYKRLVSHPVLVSNDSQDNKISKYNNTISLEDLIEGNEKIN